MLGHNYQLYGFRISNYMLAGCHNDSSHSYRVKNSKAYNLSTHWHFWKILNLWWRHRKSASVSKNLWLPFFFSFLKYYNSLIPLKKVNQSLTDPRNFILKVPEIKAKCLGNSGSIQGLLWGGQFSFFVNVLTPWTNFPELIINFFIKIYWLQITFIMCVV